MLILMKVGWLDPFVLGVLSFDDRLLLWILEDEGKGVNDPRDIEGFVAKTERVGDAV